MSPVVELAGDEDGAPVQACSRPSKSRSRRSQPRVLPADIESLVWRGTDMGQQTGAVVSSGFADLDLELPGAGWPCQSLTEVLSPQPSVLEWRLVGPALRSIVARGGSIALVGPPKTPHLPGLAHMGISERHLVWIQADAPAERLWCTEQVVKTNGCGALLSWLPQARPEQVRRLQVCAQACEGLVFLFRPAAALHEASAAPLRVIASCGLDWELLVHVTKRKGPAHDGLVRLPSVPGGLSTVLTPRLLKPSHLLSTREVADVVGSPVASLKPRRHPTTQ